MNLFVRRSPLLIFTLLLAGCAHPVEIHFVDAASREPLADLPMTKARVTTALFMQAIQAEGLHADEHGLITVSDFDDHDQLIIEHESCYALIRRDGTQLTVSQTREKSTAPSPTRIAPDADSPPDKPRYTVPLRTLNAPPGNSHKGQVVQAW